MKFFFFFERERESEQDALGVGTLAHANQIKLFQVFSSENMMNHLHRLLSSNC